METPILNSQKVIRQWKYEEQSRAVVVRKQYPKLQVDEFEYAIPFMEGGEPPPHKIGVMVSTVFNDKLFYEYGVYDLHYGRHKPTLIEKFTQILKDKITFSVTNYKKVLDKNI